MATTDATIRKPIEESEDTGAKMTFFEHLVELRKRIIYAGLAILVAMGLGFTVALRVFDFIAQPMLKALREAHLEDKLVYTSPTGVINLWITLGFYLGIAIAMPVVLYQVWLFVAPGLYRRERRYVAAFLFSTTILFVSGAAFAYYAMLPHVLRFLVGIQGPFKPLISINEYFDLVLVVLLGLGVIFEMPILIFFLSLFGIVTPKFLWKNFRYAMILITIVAAIVTPTPDATTMLVFMAPMVGLYFIGMGLSYLVVRKKRQRAAVEGAK
ncbi:MAG: twin-arginine translocase subunit TatC [Candidatus Acidiferrales bacterium]